MGQVDTVCNGELVIIFFKKIRIFCLISNEGKGKTSLNIRLINNSDEV